MRRWYVGLKNGDRHLFYSDSEPTQLSHGSIYNAVIGPFRTKRGACFMVNFGASNPHCQTVSDAERLGKLMFPTIDNLAILATVKVGAA